ncbi:MAG: AAA family ATPase [Bacteroidota bacterium]
MLHQSLKKKNRNSYFYQFFFFFLSLSFSGLLTGSVLGSWRTGSYNPEKAQYYSEKWSDKYALTKRYQNLYNYNNFGDQYFRNFDHFVKFFRMFDKVVYALQEDVRRSETLEGRDWDEKYHYSKLPRITKGGLLKYGYRSQRAHFSWVTDRNCGAIMIAYLSWLDQEGKLKEKLFGIETLTVLTQAIKIGKHDPSWMKKGGVGRAPETFEYHAIQIYQDPHKKEVVSKILKEIGDITHDAFELKLNNIQGEIMAYLTTKEGIDDKDIEDAATENNKKASIEEAKRKADERLAEAEKKRIESKTAAAKEKKEALEKLLAESPDLDAKEKEALKFEKARIQRELEKAQQQDKVVQQQQATRKKVLDNNALDTANQKTLLDAQTKLAEQDTAKLDSHIKLEEARAVKYEKLISSIRNTLKDWKMMGIVGGTVVVVAFLYKLIPFLLKIIFKPKPKIITKTSLPTSLKEKIKRLLFGKKKEKSVYHLMAYNDETQEFVDKEIVKTIGIHKKNKQLQSGEQPYNHENILLYGPPGTGKTMLALEIARNCGMDYSFVNTPLLAKLSVSEAVAMIQQIFEYVAQFRTPVIIIFDELDAVFVSREKGTNVDQKIVNTLLGYIERKNNPDMKLMGLTNLKKKLDGAFISRMRPEKIDYPNAKTLEKQLFNYITDVEKKGTRVSIVVKESLPRIARLLEQKKAVGRYVQGMLESLRSNAAFTSQTGQIELVDILAYINSNKSIKNPNSHPVAAAAA